MLTPILLEAEAAGRVHGMRQRIADRVIHQAQAAIQQLDIALRQTALDILGPYAELLPVSPDADGVGDGLGDYIFSLSGPIYAGSNEIQRNIIAERMLGLPRA